MEAVDTNVLGTANLLACMKAQGVKRAVFVSTDKARAPSTTYGASKLLGERLWLGGNTYSGGGSPELVAVAYGNVWGSNGSVLHAFREHAEKYGHLRVTDARCTRFHIKLEDAVDFVLEALSGAVRGTLWVPKLPTFSVGDLAKAFGRVFWLKKDPEETGLRPSEKLHEELISWNETPQIVSEGERLYVLDPKGQKAHRPPYTSGDMSRRMNVAHLEEEIRLWQSANPAVPKTPSL